ncbi:uncharacterized protein LOC108670246 [Hyalella azteca]|uniref:Uncharacterized protein LOC108670246 n=1 Tax=Hyalella azteca TaxID=294128 RepID=A0A979FYB7_HYAAZ|nr:uncharacterized protein LOC108670246 [Hyalella azteca]
MVEIHGHAKKFPSNEQDAEPNLEAALDSIHLRREAAPVTGNELTVYLSVTNLFSRGLYLITAHNDIGSSEPSSVVTARTKGQAPVAPPLFQFVTSNSTQATLYLTQWDSGGCPISHFVVQLRDSNNHWTTVSSEVLPSRTFAVTGLSGGGDYDIQVTAHNAAGATRALYSISTPLPQTDGSPTAWGGPSGQSRDDRNSPLWRDLRILIPMALSTLALMATLVRICICVRRSKTVTKHNPADDEVADGGASKIAQDGHDSSMLREKQDLENPVKARSHFQRFPQPLPNVDDVRNDYPGESDVYHYADSTYHLGALSPIPQAPLSRPPYEARDGAYTEDTSQRSYATLVYQIPSLNNVDSPNAVEGSSSDENYASAIPSKMSRGYRGQARPESSVALRGVENRQRRPPRHISFPSQCYE